jgi:hypothetical protein
MTRYRYSGPTTSFTLREGGDVFLTNGCTTELSPDNDYVRTLVAQGRLAPMVFDDVTPEPAKNKKSKEPTQ